MPLESVFMLHERYRVEALLGHGGMGAVYRAFDTLLDQPCAIKEFRLDHLPERSKPKPGLEDVAFDDMYPREKAAKQFKFEARMLAGLDHPNLPRVTDYFGIDQDYYLVMTLIEGKDLLASWEEQGKKPFAEPLVLEWTRQIMDALVYCHDHGITHRDVKPCNVILTESGKVYLVDFGIAKSTGEGQGASSSTAKVTTPGYSPPEQYPGQGHTDFRSDIYSLGAMMYMLLTGQRPVDAIARVMGHELPSPRRVVNSISPSVDTVIMKSMALRVEDRFQTITEMQQALKGFITGYDQKAIEMAISQANELGEKAVVEKQKSIEDSETLTFSKLSEEPASSKVGTRQRVKEESLMEVIVSPDGTGNCRRIDDALLMVKPNGHVTIREGKYLLDSPLIIDKPVSISGVGREKTLITSFEQGFVLQIKCEGKLTLDAITIKHEGNVWANVLEVVSGEFEFSDCVVMGGRHSIAEDKTYLGGDGFLIKGTASGHLDNCSAVYNTGYGVEATDETLVGIENAEFNHNGRSGIGFLKSSEGSIKGSSFLENEHNGIEAGGQTQLKLEDNLFQKNGRAGVVFYGLAGGEICKNRCMENDFHGIQIGGRSQPVVVENSVIQNNQVGIQYLEQAAGEAKNNYCERNGLHGICVNGAAWPTLDTNVCKRNMQDGIIFFGESVGLVKLNECEENGLHGIEINGQAKPQLEANSCCRNNQDGIRYTDHTSGLAINNRCDDNGLYGIEIAEYAQPRIETSFCRRNNQIGILYAGNSAGVARMNQCEANESCGIGVGGQARPTLKANVCKSNKGSGIWYTDRASGLAHSNQSTENEKHGIEIGGNAFPRIEVSICKQNRSSGMFFADSAAGIARKNECVDNGEYGILVRGQAKPVLQENLYSMNSLEDIVV